MLFSQSKYPGFGELSSEMFWILYITILGALTIMVLTVLSKRLPRDHNVTRISYFNRSPAEIWRTISDFSSQVEWRRDLESAERLPPRSGRELWIETDKRGQRLVLETIETIPHRRLVRRVADNNPEFSKTWAIDIREVGEVTAFSITESGQINNPFFRFLSKFIIGQKTTTDRYLIALGNKLGVDVTITDG